MYMTWYGAERFVVEGLRTDSLMIGSLRVSQILSAVICIISVVIQIFMLISIKKNPDKYVLYCYTEESKNILEQARNRRQGKDEDYEDYQPITDSDNNENIQEEE